MQGILRSWLPIVRASAQTCTVAPPATSTTTPSAGESITITGDGFAPNTTLTIELHSTPVVLATTQTDSAGNYSVIVVIPADTPPGAHEIVARGLGPNGEERTSVVTITVGAAPVVARGRRGAHVRRMNRGARLLVVLVALIGATTAGSARAVAADSATTTAVIVIDTGTSVRAITVDVGSGMSGLAALQRVANVTTLSFTGNGGAVCAIDGFGNEATQSGCLVGPNSQYWAYFHSSGGAGAWSYSPVGAGSFPVHGGDVEGWRYGTGAKPAASPVFCEYVTCAASPPPATTAPSAGAGTGGTGSAGTGSTGGTGGAAGPSAGGALAHTGDPTGAATDGAGGSETTQPSTSTTAPGGDANDPSGRARNDSGVTVEAAAAGTSGGRRRRITGRCRGGRGDPRRGRGISGLAPATLARPRVAFTVMATRDSQVRRGQP